MVERSELHPSPSHPSRRLFMRDAAGAAGALAAGWAQLSAAQPQGRGKAKSVILIFNCGATGA